MADQNRYGRQSFDRFGSDLCELILSYLPLNEKFKFESVCGHWQSLVFSGQTTLNITDCDGYYSLKSLTASQVQTKYYNIYRIQNSNLEKVLKKCPHIRTIKIDWKCICDEDSLELMANYCPSLSRLTISSTEHCTLSDRVLHIFGQKCGPNLNVFQTEEKFNGNFEILLNYCRNLRSIQALNECQKVVDINPDFLPKLRELNYLITNDNDLIQLKTLSEKYSKQLKSLFLNVRIAESEANNCVIRSDLNRVLESVSRLTRLEFFRINIKGYHGQPFVAGFHAIGQKCVQLRYVDLETWDSLILDNIFELFQRFTELQYLSLNCRYVYKFESMQNLVSSLSQSLNHGSVDSLANCRHLTHLKLNLMQLNDKNLESIDTVLPNLKLLELKSSKRLTEKTVHSIAKLEHLAHFRMLCKSVNSQSICHLVSERPLLRQLYLDGFPHINRDFLLILANNALNNRKINYHVYYSGPPVDLEVSRLPDNLRVSNSWDKQWY